MSCENTEPKCRDCKRFTTTHTGNFPPWREAPYYAVMRLGVPKETKDPCEMVRMGTCGESIAAQVVTEISRCSKPDGIFEPKFTEPINRQQSST